MEVIGHRNLPTMLEDISAKRLDNLETLTLKGQINILIDLLKVVGWVPYPCLSKLQIHIDGDQYLSHEPLRITLEERAKNGCKLDTLVLIGQIFYNYHLVFKEAVTRVDHREF